MTEAIINAGDIEALFTRSDGAYLFARWGRALAPVAFGVKEETLGVIKGAVDAVCQLAGHETIDFDPELGSNFMWFFMEDWQELLDVPNLDQLIPELKPLVGRLVEADANQYRIFRFDEDGAIKACFVFLRMDDQLREVSAETLALSQVVQSILLWSDNAFQDRSALAVANDSTILRPDIAAVIRAGYDPVMPSVAEDATHALRLAARVPMSN